MPLYWGDYHQKTQHLNTWQHGAYLLLLSSYWMTGRALDPADVQAIARANDEQMVQLNRIIAKFFVLGEDGLLHQSRMDEELAKAEKISEERRKAGEKGARDKKAKAVAIDEHLLTQPPSPSPSKKDLEGLVGQGRSLKPLARSGWNVLDHLSRIVRLECEEKVKKYGWDFYVAADKYSNWVKDNPPRNPEMGFPAWIDSFCSKNKP